MTYPSKSILLALSSLLTVAAPLQAAPNIVLFVADDMSWYDCAPYGSKQVHTPNLSKLASQGLCLDAMFTATAMCAPTRQQLYTGLFPVRSSAYPNHSQVRKSVKSLPHHLKKLGYRVALIGKTHYGPKPAFPFEYLGSNPNAFARIKRFINRKPTQPYCLVVCSLEPHAPWTVGDRSRYRPENISVPAQMIDVPETRKYLCHYYAEITALDTSLGKCMQLVDQSPQADNTLFMFTSEQGMSLPFGGKWSCYDAGLKTSFIIRWPGVVKARSRNAQLLQYVDVVPTLIEAAGGNLKNFSPGVNDALGGTAFDGIRFLPILRDNDQTPPHSQHQYVFGVHTTRGIINGKPYPIRSIRSQQYKLIWNIHHQGQFSNLYMKGKEKSRPQYHHYMVPLQQAASENPSIAKRLTNFHTRPEFELYDIQKDPDELTNLAEHQNLTPVKSELLIKLKTWMRQQGDTGMPTELHGKSALSH